MSAARTIRSAVRVGKHLRKCKGVGAPMHCRYFIFHDDYIIWVRKNQVFFRDLNLDFTTIYLDFCTNFNGIVFKGKQLINVIGCFFSPKFNLIL